jgi:glycosyltransferase involved in cell wall biosynthesis
LVRFYNQFQILGKLTNIKPRIIIVTAPELIPLALLFKITKHSRLVYDVQEDYRTNITNQSIYFGLTKHVLLFIHSILHWLANKYFDQIWLAELTYAKDINFVKPITILENKTVDLTKPIRHKNKTLTLIFTGVLSAYSGIQQAIDFYKNFKSRTSNCRLVIIGYAPRKRTLAYIQNQMSEDESIQLIGGGSFVDHDQIVKEIVNADLGIISYQINEVSKDRIPTKLYEYCYFNLPFVVAANSAWADVGKSNGPVIPIDFDDIVPEKIIDQMQTLREKWEKEDRSNSNWSSEEGKLIHAINDLI